MKKGYEIFVLKDDEDEKESINWNVKCRRIMNKYKIKESDYEGMVLNFDKV